MSLFQKFVGAPVSLIIGRVGEEPDEIPMRIVQFGHGKADGNPETAPTGDLAICVAWQANRDGELFYRVRKVLRDSLFLFDRSELVEQLDGTAEAPLSLQELIAKAVESQKTWARDRAKNGRQVVEAPLAPAPF